MLEFEKPSIVRDDNGEDKKYGRFVVEPLERGYGITLGNALRRVMQSSLPGTAISSIKIDGVLHEFSTIEGVKEDVTEIVLNIKGLIVKINGDGPKTVYIEEEGPKIVTAADIKCDSEVEILGVEGIPVHTDFETTGSFECSDPVVNTLQQNAINSMYSNFVSIPTDCPHREKQGWTCDTYIVSRAAMYNFNMALFFEKWVRDLALSETPQGGYTTVAPATGYDGNSSTTWPAALIYVPYDALNFYGDTRILSDNLRNMKSNKL